MLTVVGLVSATGLAGVGLILALAAAHVFMPSFLEPGTVLGDFFGSIIRAEQYATRESNARYKEAEADALARAEARKHQQIIAAENAQQLRTVTLLPQIVGSWVAQSVCIWGAATGDTEKQRACAAVEPLNKAIVEQQGSAIDDLGPTRMWQPAPAQQQAVDGPPLNRGENYAIARLEASLSEAFVAKAKANRLPGNNGMRLYLEALRVGAGEPAPPDMTAPIVVPHAGPPSQKPSGQYVPQPMHGFFGQR